MCFVTNVGECYKNYAGRIQLFSTILKGSVKLKILRQSHVVVFSARWSIPNKIMMSSQVTTKAVFLDTKFGKYYSSIRHYNSLGSE